MDFAQLYALLVSLLPVQVVSYIHMVLVALGALVVLGLAYVKITPTQDDDAWFSKLESIPILGSLLKFLVSFSPIQRKEE